MSDLIEGAYVLWGFLGITGLWLPVGLIAIGGLGLGVAAGYASSRLWGRK